MSLQLPIPHALRVLGGAAQRFLVFAFFNTLAWHLLVGSVLILHARALGLGSAWVGLLVSLMPYTMLLTLFVTPLLVRYGPKRLMLSGWVMRNLVACPLIATPWVQARWGTGAAGAVLFGGVLAFCICRAVTGVGWFPWLQEIVPATERGRYFSMEMVVGQLVNITVGVGVFIILGAKPALSSFSLICTVGVLSGFFSVILIRRIPGGGPHRAEGLRSGAVGLRLALRDRGFRRFAGWTSLGVFVASGQMALLVLYMRDFMHVAPARIMLVTAVGSACAMVVGPWWGRMADRHGGALVLFLSGMLTTLALAAFAGVQSGHVARGADAPLYALAMVGGSGFFIATNRGFLQGMRPRLRGAYTSLWTAMTSVAMGSSAVLIGQFLRSGGAWGYRGTCVGYAACMLLAGVVCLRLPEKGMAWRQELRRRYHPARPVRSVLRVSWYVLNPWDERL